MNSDLQSSQRFETPHERRDFLGLMSIWSALCALAWAMLGALQLPMPSVFPESNPRVKLGPYSKFSGTEMTPFPEQRLWIYSDAKGLYAVSAVCTHLGCIVSQDAEGYFCPCHGSRFDETGKVMAGPAPRGLIYLELSMSPGGQLVVDRQKEVAADVRLSA